MDADHRQHPRVPLTGKVKFYDWNRPFHADAAEISANGMFLKTDVSLDEGAMVTLRLSIPGLARAFTVLGRVVRTVRGSLLKPSGLAIRFLDIAAGDRGSIRAYVASRDPRAA